MQTEIIRRIPTKKVIPFFNLHGNPDSPKGPKEPKEKLERIPVSKGEPRRSKTSLKGAKFSKGDIVVLKGEKGAIESISKALNEFRYSVRLLGGYRVIENVKARDLTKGSEKTGGKPAESGFTDKISNARFAGPKKK